MHRHGHAGRPAGERDPADLVPEKFLEELSALLMEAAAMLLPGTGEQKTGN